MVGFLLKIGAAVLILIFALLMAWYQVDGQPLPHAEQYLSSNNYSVETKKNGDLLFVPKSSNGYAIAIAHGALIRPISYSKTAAFFAEKGFHVWLPKDTFLLSIMSTKRMAAYIDSHDDMKWFLLGHSMGGLTVMTIDNMIDNIEGIAIWAGGATGDFSNSTTQVLFIRGANDPMISEQRFTTIKHSLPIETQYLTMPGANHKNFALYSHQFFDGEAEIDHHLQIDQSNNITLDFFNRIIAR